MAFHYDNGGVTSEISNMTDGMKHNREFVKKSSEGRSWKHLAEVFMLDLSNWDLLVDQTPPNCALLGCILLLIDFFLLFFVVLSCWFPVWFGSTSSLARYDPGLVTSLNTTRAVLSTVEAGLSSSRAAGSAGYVDDDIDDDDVGTRRRRLTSSSLCLPGSVPPTARSFSPEGLASFGTGSESNSLLLGPAVCSSRVWTEVLGSEAVSKARSKPKPVSKQKVPPGLPPPKEHASVLSPLPSRRRSVSKSGQPSYPPPPAFSADPDLDNVTPLQQGVPLVSPLLRRQRAVLKPAQPSCPPATVGSVAPNFDGVPLPPWRMFQPSSLCDRNERILFVKVVF